MREQPSPKYWISRDRSGADSYTSTISSADNYTRWILDTYHQYIGSRIMEVGLGAGQYVGFLKDFEEYIGVDIDAKTVATVSDIRPDLSFLVSDIASDDFLERAKLHRYDTVLCVNVLEHIDDDKRATKNLLSVLRPGGFLCLFVPAFPALYNDLDRLAGHVRRYTTTSLADAIPNVGCKILRLDYFNPIGGLGWWAQKLKRYDELESVAVKKQIYFFDKYILPLSKGLNGLTKRFFGQSLVCVIRRNL